jgi:hypothetical protein
MFAQTYMLSTAPKNRQLKIKLKFCSRGPETCKKTSFKFFGDFWIFQ